MRFVAFGEMLPLVFNNYAFMYLTVTGLAVHLPEPQPFLWMAVAARGADGRLEVRVYRFTTPA